LRADGVAEQQHDTREKKAAKPTLKRGIFLWGRKKQATPGVCPDLTDIKTRANRKSPMKPPPSPPPIKWADLVGFGRIGSSFEFGVTETWETILSAAKNEKFEKLKHRGHGGHRVRRPLPGFGRQDSRLKQKAGGLGWLRWEGWMGWVGWLV
jgi:hypothetical protein